jgi:predicted O-methyltransferase YrrM
MKYLESVLLAIIDVIAAPFVFCFAAFLYGIRRAGRKRLPLSTRAFLAAGVLPVRKHYYEPYFDKSMLRRPLDEPRALPGIDWNEDEQLALLSGFQFSEELRDIPRSKLRGVTGFHFGNGLFESGDAEFLYNIIRSKKPARIIEIGSGYSTLIAARAREKNAAEDPSYKCSHVCIEPYEAPWLEKAGVDVLRSRVELVDKTVFAELSENDLLFIDSSHMIRPQGDVLFEFLEILPILQPGVIVHVHDILSPRDYLKEWVLDEMRLWNEQYLLEAFLSCNSQWKVLAAVNFLKHKYYDLLAQKCIFLRPSREPGSFYIQKIAARGEY